jgi:sugar lactone lactonase YvrE
MRRALALLFVSSTAAACGTPPDASVPPPPPAPVEAPPPPAATEQPTAAPTATASTAPKVEAPKQPPPAVRFTGAFATPESVLYDEANDRYLVSNINGKPVDVDNNGFISELSPDGAIKTPKWIEGGKNKVTLNAPKGLGISGGELWVADLTTVRRFDLKTGAPKGEVPLAGATFANDVAVSPDGKIYVSDSGLKMEGSDFKPTGTDAVWVIEKGKAKPLAKSPDLGKPNGLLVDGKSVLVCTFGTGELYRLDEKGQKSDAAKPPKGSLDGIVRVGDALLVSSWEGSTVYRGKVGGPFEAAITEVKSPADIGYDSKRKRVLVPHFLEDVVEAYDLK